MLLGVLRFLCAILVSEGSRVFSGHLGSHIAALLFLADAMIPPPEPSL